MCRDLMWENMRFCHVVHSMKRIEIFLSHIRCKNVVYIRHIITLESNMLSITFTKMNHHHH